jgi:hypothetical protein
MENRGRILGVFFNIKQAVTREIPFRGPLINCPIFLHCDTNLPSLSKFLYSPADAQLNCLKNNFKIYIKIDIKTAPTCFRTTTIIRERIIGAC